MSLAGKTVFITGGSRGIGEAIALRAARDGANVAIAAKTDQPHPTLPGTIHSVAAKIERLGGRALAVVCDVRDEAQIIKAIADTVAKFGGIDIVVNNASALHLIPTETIPTKRFDLLHQVNVRATFLVSKHALPHLKQSTNPHILNIAPPLSMRPQWFKDFCAYTISKYGMSMCVLGCAAEFKPYNIAVNALWPKVAIQTAALRQIDFLNETHRFRTTEIMSDAAHIILTKDSKHFTGNLLLDELVLLEHGVKDLSQYAEVPGTTEFINDFFIDDEHELAIAKLKANL